MKLSLITIIIACIISIIALIVNLFEGLSLGKSMIWMALLFGMISYSSYIKEHEDKQK